MVNGAVLLGPDGKLITLGTENTPGNVRIQNQGNNQAQSPFVTEMMARLAALEEQNKRLLANTSKSRRPISKPYRTPVLDTVTKVEYPSKAACARALFPVEHAKNHFYFEVMNVMFPGRFKTLPGVIKKQPVATVNVVVQNAGNPPANTQANPAQ